jgi:hypothetical protein
MTITPLPRKRLRFTVEDGFEDGTRLSVASVELDSKEALRLLSHLADVME